MELIRELESATLIPDIVNILLKFQSNFEKHIPNILNSRFQSVLVGQILPHYYSVFNDYERDIFLNCISNITGIESMLLYSSSVENIEVLHDLQSALDAIVRKLDPKQLHSILDNKTWTQYVKIMTSGKMVNTMYGLISKTKTPSWICDRNCFFEWWGRCVYVSCISCTSIYNKNFLLKHAEAFESGCKYGTCELMIAPWLDLNGLDFLKEILQLVDIKIVQKVFIAFCYLCYDKYLVGIDNDLSSTRISGLAYLLKRLFLIKHIEYALKHSKFRNLSLQRACVACVSETQISCQNCLDYVLDIWSDEIAIKKMPIIEQEGQSTLILLLVAHLNKTQAKTILRSPKMIQGVTLRLSAAMNRSRELGAVVAQTISDHCDDVSQRLDFSLGVHDFSEWKATIKMNDKVGCIDDLSSGIVEEPLENIAGPEMIEELSEDSCKKSLVISFEEAISDPDLKPLQTCDSDDPDSEDDPSLVSKVEILPPVFIKQLIFYLRSSDSFEKIYMGLKHSTLLIRRKTGMGMELSSQAIELCDTLLLLQDSFNMEGFENMRFNALLSISIALPNIIGPHLSGEAFSTKLNLADRITVISILIITGKQISGAGETSIESEQLLGPASTLEAHEIFSKGLTKYHPSNLKPFVISSQPDAFSSDAHVLYRSKKLDLAPRPRKRLSSNIGKYIIFPLIASWWDLSGTDSTVELHGSELLIHFIKALGIFVECSAGVSPNYSDILSEVWKIVLLNQATDNPVLQESLLFVLITILIKTKHEMLLDQFLQELIVSQNWARGVLKDSQHSNIQNLAETAFCEIKRLLAFRITDDGKN